MRTEQRVRAVAGASARRRRCSQVRLPRCQMRPSRLHAPQENCRHTAWLATDGALWGRSRLQTVRGACARTETLW